MISTYASTNFTTSTATDETTNPDFQSPPTTSRKKPSSVAVGAAVGGTIAGLILISAPIALALYLRRSKKRRESLTRPPSPRPPEPLPPALVEGLPDAPTARPSGFSNWLTFGLAGRQKKKNPDIEESESAPSRDQALPTAVDEQQPSSSGEAAARTSASAAAPPGLANTASQGHREGEVEGQVGTPPVRRQGGDIGQQVEDMEKEMQEHMSQAQQLQQEIDSLKRNSINP